MAVQVRYTTKEFIKQVNSRVKIPVGDCSELLHLSVPGSYFINWSALWLLRSTLQDNSVAPAFTQIFFLKATSSNFGQGVKVWPQTHATDFLMSLCTKSKLPARGCGTKMLLLSVFINTSHTEKLKTNKLTIGVLNCLAVGSQPFLLRAGHSQRDLSTLCRSAWRWLLIAAQRPVQTQRTWVL